LCQILMVQLSLTWTSLGRMFFCTLHFPQLHIHTQCSANQCENPHCPGVLTDCKLRAQRAWARSCQAGSLVCTCLMYFAFCPTTTHPYSVLSYLCATLSCC
jgi:hypothetical protein